MKHSWLLLTALLLGCSGGSGSSSGSGDKVIIPTSSVPQPDPAVTSWHIGPWLGVLNYSEGLPLYMTQGPDGPYFDFGPGQSPHYVTTSVAGLGQAKAISMHFRIDGPADASIYGWGCNPTSKSKVFLYFSWPTTENTPLLPIEDRVNWSQTSQRWWSAASSDVLEVGKEYTVTAPLTADAKWRTVFAPVDGSGSLSTDHPDWFARDKGRAGRVGFTFSNCTGAGHGATASKTVRFVLLDFTIQP